MTLNDLTIKRVEPLDLSASQTFNLAYIYHINPASYTVVYDKKSSCLFVNPVISEDDAKKFLIFVSYKENRINDPECPIAEVVEYIYETFGWDTYRILIDIHADRMHKIADIKAKEKAKEILPLIKSEIAQVVEGEVLDPFNEELVYCIGQAGNEDNHKTARNLVGYSTKYVFYLGYLLGAGKIKM